MSTQRVPKGVTTGGQFAPDSRTEASVALAPERTPASVLGSAIGTDRNPFSTAWPDRPKAYVEVNVSDDDARDVLEGHGVDGDIVDDYQQVYATLDLIADKEADFWGVKSDGTTDVLAVGVHNYEQAVDPGYHEDLNYRPGYSNPMPAYVEAQKAVREKRAAAAHALLADAGLSLDIDDLRREELYLRTGDGKRMQLRMKTGQYGRPGLVETRNWRPAESGHIEDFLGGQADEAAARFLTDTAAMAARDLIDRAYKEQHGN